MNEYQKKFFAYLAQIQRTNVNACIAQYGCDDTTIETMLYDVTYSVITDIMEMIDGYSAFSNNKHDIVNTVTGEHLKCHPLIKNDITRRT